MSHAEHAAHRRGPWIMDPKAQDEYWCEAHEVRTSDPTKGWVAIVGDTPDGLAIVQTPELYRTLHNLVHVVRNAQRSQGWRGRFAPGAVVDKAVTEAEAVSAAVTPAPEV